MSGARDGAPGREFAMPPELLAECASYLRARAEVERFVFLPMGALGAKGAAPAVRTAGIATPAFVTALPTAAPITAPSDATEATDATHATHATHAARVIAAQVLPVARAESVAPPARPVDSADRLAAFHDEIKDCVSCQLGYSRTRFVFGSGSATADLMLVGEAPGREEDLQGVPFVGAAGELLTKILAAIQLRREEVYIANVLKCRPPGNRDPEPHEVESCKPYLAEQIRTIAPRLIVALGRFAAQLLTGRASSLSQLRGGTYFWEGIPVIPTYHPSALLRYPTYKRPTWEDMKRVRAELDRLASPPNPAGQLT
ncbi:MAG: uracil-DNA glycosylase [bacterium]